MRFVAIATILIAGCGGRPAGVQAPALAIVPAQAEVQTGAVLQFAANQPAAWSLAEGPAGGAIAADGRYTAPAASGTVHVVARTGTESATAVVRVVSNVTVTVDPTASTLGPGMTARFHAAVAGAANTAVAWSIAEGSVGGTIYPEGVYIAPLTEGVFHVVAASVADPARTATATVTVSGAVMAVDPPSATVAAGDRITFRSQPGAAWSIQEGAAGGSITQGGAYLAPADHGGTYHVVAAAGSARAVAVVTVLPADLIDGGGPVVPATRTFALWWGDPQRWASGTRGLTESLLRGLDGSAYLAIADQYLRGETATTRFAGSFADASTPEDSPDRMDNAAVGGKACAALIANGITPSAGDAVIVYSAAGLSPAPQYCAWHSWFRCSGVDLLIAFVPNPAGSWGCLGVTGHNCNHASPEASAVASLTAHELMEAITDPFGTAWTTAAGAELGDMCEAQLACVTLSTGNFLLQGEYSNAVHACVP